MPSRPRYFWLNGLGSLFIFGYLTREWEKNLFKMFHGKDALTTKFLARHLPNFFCVYAKFLESILGAICVQISREQE